jgi:aryl-alcohol dehydrogenase-like predicted oxidoreductase
LLTTGAPAYDASSNAMTTPTSTPLGATGLFVSRLGLGCGALGDARLSDRDAERLVLGALDLGVTVLDAARSYGLAEERLGRILGSRRDGVVLSTKGGYGAAGADDWTAAAVARGIDDALVRLRTDRIDVFHLHSCAADVMRSSGVVDALLRAREAGKVRVAAYSGDNEALAWAVGSGAFACVQCSVSLFDQHALRDSVSRAASAGIGVLAKRPLGNAPWRFVERPHGHDAELTWDRMKALGFDPAPDAWDDLALRFAAFAPGVACALVGTTSLDHIRDAARHLERGPLPTERFEALRARYDEVGAAWPARI